MSTGGTTSKIKPSCKVGAFLIFDTHLILTSALYFICKIIPEKTFKSSKNVSFFIFV